jgi:hypothetical protein
VDKLTVDKAREEAERSYVKFSLLKDAYIKAESDYIKKVDHFKNLDYKLALEDGRLKKVPPSEGKERKTQKQPELTLDQLKAIAAKLGVNISIEEPEEESEEVQEVNEDETSL